MQHRQAELDKLVERCLAAFVEAGTLDLTLDQLAGRVGTSKRMLLHYFKNRENLEEQAMTRLEDRLRGQFAPEAFPPGVAAETVVTTLWEQATAAQSKGVLLLVMDLSRRAWKGSKRAQAFYHEQQRLWVELLLKFIPDLALVEEVLQLFQGSVLAFLITGDREPGRRALLRCLERQRKAGQVSRSHRKKKRPKPV